ncbi:hypothetical protein ACFOLK_17900 [Marinococcus halophilus]|nr:hypothetical protein [Marinococcus halophilus]
MNGFDEVTITAIKRRNKALTPILTIYFFIPRSLMMASSLNRANGTNKTI